MSLHMPLTRQTCMILRLKNAWREILQKFSNYRMKLAIVGDFSGYRSKSLRDFIGECNRGSLIFFEDNEEAALNALMPGDR